MRHHSQIVVSLFLKSTQVILLITLCAKIATLVEHPSVLNISDVVTTIRFKQLLILSGAIELILITFLWTPVSPILKVSAVLYFSLIAGSYRIVTHIAGQRWCPCLGNFADWASINQDQVNKILNIIVVYLLFGSLTSLIAILAKKRLTLRPASIRSEHKT